MKASTKYWISSVSALALMAGSASVQAADMALKAAPAPLPVTNWTGWYIGGHVGVASATSYCQPLNAGSTPDFGCANEEFNTQNWARSNASFVGGVEVGMDWQSRYFVYGVAADWSWTNLKGSAIGHSGSI